jgi:glycosyltransferase involved in cell wall biosynthesis
MTAAWSLEALRSGSRYDVVLVGTDPILSVTALRAWKLFRPSVKRVHWAFDVYPQAAVADGLLRPGSLAARLLSRVAASGVRAAHLVADIGPCMRSLLPASATARRETLPPWALVEPPVPLEADPEERRALFGDARLGILYSGSFGRAHSFTELLALARRLRGTGVHLAFSVRGNREAELRAAVTPDDTNVSFAPFVPEGDLFRRLGAADIHAVSLRPEWTGTVVPSKFQAALAAGRPVLFAGSPDAAPARWTSELGLGFNLASHPDSIESAATALLSLADDPGALAALRTRCHEANAKKFSREATVARWDAALRELVAA